MSYGYGGRQNPYDQRDPAPGNYGQQQAGGYGQQQPGGYGRQQPAGYGQNQPGGYGQRQPGGYGQSQPYGGDRPGYGQQDSGAAYGAGSNLEMGPVSNSSYGNILDECTEIDNGINEVEANLEEIRRLQQRSLDDADSTSASSANRQLDSLSASTMTLYRKLTERVRALKSKPQRQIAQYRGQVDRIDRRLKTAIQQYQQIESQFRKRTQDQMARQYRIVRPNAPEDEIRAAVEDTSNNQVFSQAMLQSDRQGRARAALSAVEDRHAALVKIEQQMIELSQLFQDMDTLVVQQEAAVMNIEQKGEEVTENLGKGNDEIGVAVNTARKTRKKKWICLGICVAIIVIIVVIVVIYFLVIKQGTGGGNKNKREITGFVNGALSGARSLDLDPEVSKQMARIMRERLHFPQQIAN